LTPSVRWELIQRHKLAARWPAEAPYMNPESEVEHVRDLVTPIPSAFYPRLLPAVREHREDCGCRTETLRNGWVLLHACDPGHGHKLAKYVICDEDGDVLSWTSTPRSALREAKIAAERPMSGPEAVAIVRRVAGNDAACRCVDYSLACGWRMTRSCCLAHGRDRYTVLEPGGHPDGIAAVRAWGETKAAALAMTREVLDDRAADKAERRRARLAAEDPGQLVINL
jgi:hypothetical protein